MPAVLALILLLSLAVLPASAAVYRHTDAQGRVSWSDRPGGEAVSLPQPQVITLRREEGAAVDFTPYRRLALVPPAGRVSAERGRRGVALRVALSPALRDGHRLRLIVDGEHHQSALASRVLMANGLDSGRHRLTAELVDAADRVRQRSQVLIVEVEAPR